MTIVQGILLTGRDLLEQVLIIKKMRCLQMLFLVGKLIQVVKCIVHPAVFNTQHGTMCLLRPRGSTCIGPVTDAAPQRKCRFVTGETVYIHNTVQQLMHRIPGNPGFGNDIGPVLLDQVKLQFHILRILDHGAENKSRLALGMCLALQQSVDRPVDPVQQDLLMLRSTLRIGISL